MATVNWEKQALKKVSKKLLPLVHHSFEVKNCSGKHTIWRLLHSHFGKPMIPTEKGTNVPFAAKVT